MARPSVFRGLEANDELRAKDYVRDVRPLWRQVFDLFCDRMGNVYFLMAN